MTERLENAIAAQLARQGGAAAKIGKEICDPEFTPCTPRLQGHLRSWDDVAYLIDRLNLVADEKECLLQRIRWAQLKLDLGLDVGIADLVEETEIFKQVSAALAERPVGATASRRRKEAA